MLRCNINVLEMYFYGKGKQNDPYMIEIYQMPGAQLNKNRYMPMEDAVHTHSYGFDLMPDEVIQG